MAVAALASLLIPAVVSAKPLPPIAPAINCADLLNVDFSKVMEAPFRLDTATLEPASATSPKPYCKVTGYTAAQVHFEVRLPTQGWTQRFLMFGCGGYCGAVSIPDVATVRQERGCVPLVSGEMVIASHDAGHVRKSSPATPSTPGPFADGLFALNNPDALVDFAYSGVHKATVAAKALLRTFYGQAQQYSYYSGCSDGGRQGLQEVQRYPADYDGVLGGANTIDVVETNTFYHGWNVRVNAAQQVPGTDPPQYTPILTSDKIPLLHQAVLAACANFAGGLKDMVQDPRGCNFNARSLICPGGADAPNCLTPAQAEAANSIWRGPIDENGEHLTAGDMPFGSEPGWVGSMVTAPGVPLNFATSGDYQFSWDWPHYMARFGAPLDIDNSNMRFTREEYNLLTQLDQLFTPTNPDLRPFAARGGKLLMWHGWADTGSTPFHSLNYYDAVRRFVGAADADRFLALYMVPGVYHCNGGPRPTSEDFLTQLINWVEDGVRPGKVVINYETNATNPAVTMTRPVWPYPSIAAYTGTGAPTDAANFVQAAPQQQFSDRFEWVGIGKYAPGRQLECRWEAASLTCSARGNNR